VYSTIREVVVRVGGNQKKNLDLQTRKRSTGRTTDIVIGGNVDSGETWIPRSLCKLIRRKIRPLSCLYYIVL